MEASLKACYLWMSLEGAEKTSRREWRALEARLEFEKMDRLKS